MSTGSARPWLATPEQSNSARNGRPAVLDRVVGAEERARAGTWFAPRLEADVVRAHRDARQPRARRRAHGGEDRRRGDDRRGLTDALDAVGRVGLRHLAELSLHRETLQTLLA